ncbi:hypothetical protein IU450_38825 [Nocardia abscessus]|uniref:hypothetical protein n=1 Tax=Nocardia abscessus TaxID=120957 RepID=UPI001895AEB5|nr:hypothetical protein [Nocardia abscessus]MBF6341792.1 hypothetical protein [Nocardia abscessus]
MSKKKNAASDPTETAAPAPEHGTRSGRVPVLSRDSDSALWAALGAHPDSTTAALADIAGIGLSTARRLLAQWETAGCAQSHTDPESPRAAKTWTTGAGAPATIEPDPAAPVDPVPVPGGAAPAEPATPETTTPEPVSPVPVTPADLESVTPAADPTQEVAVPGSDVPADPEPDATAETALAAPTGDDSADPAPVTPAPADATTAANAESTVERLPAGALRGQVDDFLRDNPGKEFTPHQIGKELGRSSGAVHNALVTLTKNGIARQTSAAPKRFTLAS